MANVIISQLPLASALTGAELVPIQQNGNTVQTTTSAIAVQPTQTQPFLTIGQQTSLANSRQIAVSTGLTFTDGGAQSSYTIAVTGALSSLVNSSNGIQVKTNSTTLTNVSIASSGVGVSIANADGTAGNPTISLSTVLQNLVGTTGTGLLAISGTTFNTVAIAGTSGQISVANGSTSPVISLATTAVTAGTYTIATVTFDAYGRATSASNTATTGTGSVVLAGSPALTGTPTAPTATTGTNTTQLATTAFVTSAIGGSTVVNSFSAGTTGLTPNSTSSGAITLGGTLAVANGGTGVTSSTGSGSVVLSASPTFTGTPSAPTAALNTNTTQLATTAYVIQQVSASGGGTVTSVGGTGTVNGITLTGTVTASGNLTLGGTLSGVSLTSQVSGTLPVANGGTNLTTYTIGDTLYASGTTALSKLGIGSAGQVLTVNSGATAPQWSTISSVSTATNLAGGALGSIPYQNASGTTLFLAGNTTTTPQFVTSTGASSLATAPTLTGSTGSGSVVLATSPTLVTPALGTPSSGVVTNLTGTASININGTVGATTPSTGAFTYLSTSGSTSTTPVLSFNASNSPISAGATISSSYLQFVMQNKSATANASTNYVLSNDSGTDSSYYGEFGMNSTVFSTSTPSDFFSINNGVYFSAHDGDVSVGSGTSNKTYLTFLAGVSAHVINNSGAIGLSTNLGTTPALSGTTGFGTSGQVLTSAGSAAAPTWTTPNASTVTLAAGTGATNYLTFSATATGNQPLTTNTSLTYNYTNNALTAGINGGTF